MFNPMFRSAEGKDLPLETVWRIPFEKTVETPMFDAITQGVVKGLDTNFPDYDWALLATEKLPDGTMFERNYLQIYRCAGSQPAHLDTGLPWFWDDDLKKPWCPLSVVLNINDGPEPWLSKKPIAGLFHRVVHGAPPDDVIAQNLQRTLTNVYDKEKAGSVIRRNRAGQCVAFHAGEYPHAGTGYDFVPDWLHPGWVGRVTAYFLAVPRKFLAKTWKLRVFCADEGWGLMSPGVSGEQVAM